METQKTLPPILPSVGEAFDAALNLNNKDQKVSILELIPPLREIGTASLQLDAKQKAAFLIRNLEKTLNSEFDKSELEKAQGELKQFSLDGLDQEAISHVIKLIDELLQGNYEQSSIREYLGWNLRLTLNQLEGKSSLLTDKINDFSEKILNQNYEIKPRSDLEEIGAGKISYLLVDKEDQKPFAILKSNPPHPTTVQKVLFPYMTPKKAEGWEQELIGSELDQISGFDHTPLTFGARFLNEGKEVQGLVQEYIPNSKSGDMLHNVEGGKLLSRIPHSIVQSFVLSGIFKGLTAGHIGNYQFPLDKNTLKEIDLEEILPEFNRLDESEREKALAFADKEIKELSEKVSDVEKALVSEPERDDLKKQLEDLKNQITKVKQRKAVIKCITMSRMWILGFPQNNRPLDTAAMIAINHPSLLPLLKQYQGTVSNISEDAWRAQLSRVEEMQSICSKELEKDTKTLTPVDLYFAIFGGEELWKKASENGFPKIWTSNSILGCPHPYAVTKEENPLDLPICKRLEVPKDNTESQKEIVNFFRIMEGLEPKTFE